MTPSLYSRGPSAMVTGLLLLLAACSVSPTPYQAADGGGGYADRKLENGNYQVTFAGNAATPKRSIQEAVLFRAAQVTLQADSSYFKVLANTVEPASEPAEGSGFDVASIFGGGSEEGLVSTLDFVLLEDEPTEKDPNIYNAEALIGELKDSVLASSSAAAAVRDGAIVDNLRAPRAGDF